MGTIGITAEGFAGSPEIEVHQQEITFGDPLKNMQIRRNRASNLFGKVRNNNTKNYQGFDYYASVGTNTFAVADGEIVYIVDTESSAYGRQAVLKINDSKYFAFYAHLSKISVGLNAKVKKGDTIGQTGICTLNAGHLHYWGVDFPAVFLQTTLLKQNFTPKTLMQNHKARVEFLRLIKIRQKQKWILYGKNDNNLFHRDLIVFILWNF